MQMSRHGEINGRVSLHFIPILANSINYFILFYSEMPDSRLSEITMAEFLFFFFHQF